MSEKILVSRANAESLAGITSPHLRVLVSRGRLVEADALIGDTVRKGVTLASLAAYFGWSPRTCDSILEQHGIDPASEGYHYLTAREEG